MLLQHPVHQHGVDISLDEAAHLVAEGIFQPSSWSFPPGRVATTSATPW
jgi:hypothetical protein